MRSLKQFNFKKTSPRTKIKKKRNGRNWHLPIKSRVSDKNIENINEAIRKNKSASCDSKSSWKLLPKDSCEVYRDRRRRQQYQRRDGSLSDEQLEQNQIKMKKKGRKRGVRNAKKQKPIRKNEKRQNSESTMNTNSDSQMTKSSVCSACASSSEMES